MQTFSIGPTLIDLSNFLETRIEDDTLVAYPPRTDFVVLRFTVISTVKDGKDVAGSGEKSVRESAIEDKAQLQVCGDKVWYHVDKLSSNGSPGSLMHYWYVALGGHTLVASCFVDAAESNNALTKRVLSLVEPAILSFRRKPE